jgi:hypothetical protein
MSVHLYAASEFQYTWRGKDEFTTVKVVRYNTGICISPSCLKGLDSDPSQLVFYRLPTSTPEKMLSTRRDAKQKRDFYCGKHIELAPSTTTRLRLSVLPARSFLWGQDVTPIENYFVPFRRLLIL